MMNRKVLFLTLVIYIAFLSSTSYGDINQKADVTISPNTPASDGKYLVTQDVPATFEITIDPTESLGKWESLTLTLSDKKEWSITVVDAEGKSIVGENAFKEENNTITIEIDNQTINDGTRKYSLSIGLSGSADEETTLTFDNFKFAEDPTVEPSGEKSFVLKIKESIVTDVKFDPTLPVERLPIDQGGVLNQIATVTIEFNQEPGGVWEELRLELKDVNWLTDVTAVKMQIYRDRDGNGEFNENEDALVGQGKFSADANEKISTDIFLYQSVPKTGVYFFVLILDQIVPVGQEMTLIVPNDGFLFTNARTGPRDGEFKLVIAGEQKIQILPLTESLEYVPYGSEATIASIEIITDSKVKYWTSLLLGKPDLISDNAVSSISIYRDDGSEPNKPDSTDTLIGQVNGFKDNDQAVDTVEIKFDEPEHLKTVTKSPLDFNGNLTNDEINRFLLVMKAGTEDEVKENDRLDAVIAENAFSFENRYLLELTKETASPQPLYLGTSGPTIGKLPETYIDLSICKSDIVDENFRLNYIAKTNSGASVEFYYTNKTIDQLRSYEEDIPEDTLVGYIGSSQVELTERQSYIWETEKIHEGKYYIYARIVNTPLTNEKAKELTTEEYIKIITSEDPTSDFSDCVVSVVHPLSIRELNHYGLEDGFYRIEWKYEKKGDYDVDIDLYYSEKDLDPDDELDGYNKSLQKDWRKYDEDLKKYETIIGNIESLEEGHIAHIVPTEEERKSNLGQYEWNLIENGVKEGRYSIYAVISDGEHKAAVSEKSFIVSYEPMIKLISPIPGSQAIHSYTISWIDQDVDDNAEISLYYSDKYYLDEKKELEDFVENDIASNVIVDKDLFENDDGDKGFYTWELDDEKWNNLSGSYYVYAKISDSNNGKPDYAVSPGTLLIKKGVKIRLWPSMIALGQGEKYEFELQVESPKSVTGVNIYISYDPDYLNVAEKHPFSSPVVEKKPAGGKPVEEGKEIRYEYINEKDYPKEGNLVYSISADLNKEDDYLLESPSGFQTVAKLTFEVKKVEEYTINSAVSFDFDEAHNRNTSILIEDTDKKHIEVTPECLINPALIIQLTPMATISGRVLLEGRTNYATQLTFGLREFDTLNTISKEVTSKSDGSYILTNIPAGIWELVVKAPSYLRSRYESNRSILLRVVPGDNLQNIDILGDDKLIGGDVNNDNRINTTDLSLLSNSFGTSKGEGEDFDLADIDHDGRVTYTDFVILAKNFGKIGAPDVVPQASGGESTPAAAPFIPISISIDTSLRASSPLVGGTEGGRSNQELKQRVVQTGEIVEIPIEVSNAMDLRGFAFEVEYNPQIYRLVGAGARLGKFLQTNADNQPVLFISKEIDEANASGPVVVEDLSPVQSPIHYKSSIYLLGDELKRIVTAGIIAGKGESVSGSGVLAKLQFECIAEGETSIRINEFMIADSSNQFIPIDYKVIYNLLSFDRPTETKLLQNYPNPFNPETWIPFTLNTDSNVEIYIYSQNGQLIKRIVLGNLKPSNYTHREFAAYWNGRNNVGEKVSSGVYFYQLKADSATGSIVSHMKKMVILK